MAAEALEKSALESKDKDQLMAIADALGVKAVARDSKATLVEKILERPAQMTNQHQRVHHVVVKHVPKKIPRKQRPSVQSAALATIVAIAKSVHRVAKSPQHQTNQSYM